MTVTHYNSASRGLIPIKGMPFKHLHSAREKLLHQITVGLAGEHRRPELDAMTAEIDAQRAAYIAEQQAIRDNPASTDAERVTADERINEARAQQEREAAR